MINDPIKASLLSMKMIPSVDDGLIKEFSLPPGHRSIGFLTSDIDDVAFIGMDEATKKADVKAVYAESFYGGADCASTQLAGETLCIISGPDPAEVRSGLDVIKEVMEAGNICYYSANADDSIVYFAHCVSRTGSFLAETASIQEGEALAYLVAPPEEFIYAIDTALKAAEVKIAAFDKPPTVTNFGGAFLTGSQSACKSACDAFADAVKFVAANPTAY